MKATKRQCETLDDMKIVYHDEITVEEASELIARYIEQRNRVVEDFKRNNSIDQIVEQYSHQTVGRDHKIFAPWRQEATPSVHIYADGTWWDYGAGKGGDVLDFLGCYFFGEQYSREVHFADVVDRIGALDIKPLPRPLSQDKPKPPKPKTRITLEQIMAWADALPAQYRDYWRSRGLLDQTIDRFLLGYDGRRLTIPALYRGIPFAVRRRVTPDAWRIAKDRYNAQMQPWRDANPTWTDKDIIAAWREQLHAEHPDWTADQIRNALPSMPPKYVGIEGDISGIFNSDVLPNAHSVIITEGEADCMLIDQLGYTVVSFTAGARAWKEDWAKFFTHIREIFLLFDNDETGRAGAARVRATLRRAKIVTYPDGVKDMGELWAAGCAANWLQEAIR